MSKYTDDMRAALNIYNPYDIGRRYDCPVIYFHTQHAHAMGTGDHRVEVHYIREGRRYKTKPIRLRGGLDPVKSRAAHLEAGIELAAKRNLGVEEWVPSGFSNTWIPKAVKERIMADLKAWRKEQRAATKEDA